jgi:hypothetical protein
MVAKIDDADMDEEINNTITFFAVDDVVDTTKCSNFNKGFRPGFFDGKLFKSSTNLNDKVMAEITDALNITMKYQSI